MELKPLLSIPEIQRLEELGCMIVESEKMRLHFRSKTSNSMYAIRTHIVDDHVRFYLVMMGVVASVVLEMQVWH